MTDKQPEALRLADAHKELGWIACTPEWGKDAAAMLRAQHAAIERKDALLRQALEALEFDMSKFAFSAYYAAREEAVGAITKELSQ